MNAPTTLGRMRRQALLVLGQSINRPNSETVLTAFREFLLSNLGGAWEPGEVAFLDNHSAGYVRGKIESMREADYALVVFRGAGQTVKQNPVSSLMADLMSTAETWAAERQGVLGIGDALTLARSRISSTDVATYSGVRRRGDYPFAANRVS